MLHKFYKYCIKFDFWSIGGNGVYIEEFLSAWLCGKAVDGICLERVYCTFQVTPV